MLSSGRHPVHPAAAPADLSEDACRRLWLVRMSLVAMEGLIIFLAAGYGPLRLPLLALSLVLGLQFLLTVFMDRRIRAGGGMAQGEAFLHLLADAGAIATLVYLTGGYANPFVSLLLVPLILAASLFGARLIWAMAGAVALAYTLLMRYYQPLALEMSGAEAVNLHLLGMWLNFLLTAGLIALFIARLTATLRVRDAALAEARERALRDERLFALGMQAAAAAHDLATPVATLGLSLDELGETYAGDDELAPELATMSQQVKRMGKVLAALRTVAQAVPSQTDDAQAADAWLAELLRHWRELRADAEVELARAETGDAPPVRDEPLLNAALVTLLNNAADVGGSPILVRLGWDADALRVEVLDRGPGLERAQEGKPAGWGVGLQLARTAMERVGGSLELEPRAGGGLCARLRVPLAAVGAVA